LSIFGTAAQEKIISEPMESENFQGLVEEVPLPPEIESPSAKTGPNRLSLTRLLYLSSRVMHGVNVRRRKRVDEELLTTPLTGVFKIRKNGKRKSSGHIGANSSNKIAPASAADVVKHAAALAHFRANMEESAYLICYQGNCVCKSTRHSKGWVQAHYTAPVSSS
jgi:hypothetical protein